MRTVGKVELDIVEMLVCTGCNEVRDPEDRGLVLDASAGRRGSGS